VPGILKNKKPFRYIDRTMYMIVNLVSIFNIIRYLEGNA